MVKAAHGDARRGITDCEAKAIAERWNKDVCMILVFHIFKSERGNSNELLQLCQRYLVSGYRYKTIIKCFFRG